MSPTEICDARGNGLLAINFPRNPPRGHLTELTESDCVSSVGLKP
jgi:hypothetical protein